MLAELAGILTFDAGYNTAVVMVGSTIFGTGAGVIGCFALLRRQSMISDAISHATLPGIALAFLAGLALFGNGRNIVLLTLGAAATGALGILAVHWIRDRTRLGEDAAIATVLSVFFGGGVVLLSYIQTLPSAGQAGLDGFLLGATATMTGTEALTLAIAAAAVVAVTLFLLRPFGAVCLDPRHAATLGLPVSLLDLLMTGLLLAIVAIGLKTVGLILVIALVIIPPVTARFWSDRLGPMVAVAGLAGGLACYAGSALSALYPDAPTGAVIVILSGIGCAGSLVAAPARGVLAHLIRGRRFRRRVARRQALLQVGKGEMPDRAHLRLLRSEGLVGPNGIPTGAGRRAALAVADDWRLWERYLALFPDQALTTPEWGSRPVEDLLSPDLVAELRRQSSREGPA